MISNKARAASRFLYRWKDYGVGYLFMLPWIIGFSVFMAFPIIWSFSISFTKVSFTPTGFKYVWIGLDNFRDALMKDNEYPIELFAFFQEMIVMVPIIIIFAYFVSIFLNQNFPGRFVFRAIFFLPVIFATGQVLIELFNQGAGELPFMDQYGVEALLNEYVSPQFIKPVTNILRLSVIILWYSGVQILIFIAGFQTIPRSTYEAVRIDGASPWESFWKITAPAMTPFVALNTIYTIVDLFTFPLNPVMEQVRKNMFKVDTGYGYASALAWLYFFIVMVLLAIVMGVMTRSARKMGG